MDETLLSFEVKRLWQLLVRESERFQGVEEQFDVLKYELEQLRVFVEGFRKHKSAMMREIIREIKEIVFDAEDIVKTFLLKVKIGNESGIRNNMRKFSCVILEQKKVDFSMEAISKRISKVIVDMQIMGVQPVAVNEELYTQGRQMEMRQTFSSDTEDHLVGMEKKIEILVIHLVEKDINSQVVSIIGMGGIGKTTLARKVYNHEIIRSHFSALVWVCLSQLFCRQNIWQAILQQLRPEYCVTKMCENELQEKIAQQLDIQKTLIVIDDIWREEDWDIIKPVFPPKAGWKVLLTSRNEGVALHADPKCIIFKPECLTLEESWNLFQSLVFYGKDTTEYKFDKDMEYTGKDMIERCGGLPLAVKVLGGLLAAHSYTLDNWKRIHENIGSHIVRGRVTERSSSVYPILYMSFEELPSYLKQCFLYLAYLPERLSIDVEDLSYYWAAEGILRPEDGEGASIQEITDEYIEELVKRNMVISERNEKTSRYQRCRLHDMMREVCLLAVEEENFVQIVDASTNTSTKNSQCPNISRRLVIQSSDHTFQVERYTQNQRLRSLLFIKHHGDTHWMASGLRFRRLQLMRILDLSRAEFKGGKLPSSIGKLIHLRYLSLYMTKVSRLPSSMRHLKQLLYLNLCVGSISPTYMPDILEEMRKLIYLFLPDEMQDKVKLKLGNLTNLETLENFSTKHISVSDLQHMTRLRTLSIIFNGEGCTMEALSSTLGELGDLEILTIGSKRVVGVRVMGKVPPMSSAGLEGKRMVCSSSGFPKLKKLYLNSLAQWEEWEIEEGSMPLLQTLSISLCRKLKALPDGLEFITSLEELTITKSGRDFKEKLSTWGEDYNKVRHIPCVTISESGMNDFDDESIRVYKL